MRNINEKCFVTEQHALCRSIARRIIYPATQIRPFLAVVVSMLASQIHKATETHFVSAKRALYYYNGTTSFDMKIKPGDGRHLTAYFNASSGSDAEKGSQSRSGLLLHHGNIMVAATTILQMYISLSYTEAKYIVVSEGTNIIMCL